MSLGFIIVHVTLLAGVTWRASLWQRRVAT